MPQYTLQQSVKTLEKIFENNIDTEQKIKNLKWENLKQFRKELEKKGGYIAGIVTIRSIVIYREKVESDE